MVSWVLDQLQAIADLCNQCMAQQVVCNNSCMVVPQCCYRIRLAGRCVGSTGLQ